jgi:dipeptidyl aminopeptidase/acylaminoacyl peptidase
MSRIRSALGYSNVMTTVAVLFALGGGLALVLPAGAQAAFPGQNGRVAFAAYSSGTGYLEFVETRNTVRSIDVVAPSGSGRRSLRACTRVLTPLNSGGDGMPLVPDRGDCSIEYATPAWSPDGKRLAFDGGLRLAVMRSDGSGFRLLGQQTADDSEPAWSPDGRKLVFSGARGGEPDAGTDLYIVELRSGKLRQLTFRGGGDHSPAWSSRGRIAFTRGGVAFTRGGGELRPGTGNIHTVRPDSRGLRQLTYRNGSDPAWSPHASKLIFVRARMRHRAWSNRLYTVRANGGGLTRVTTPGADLPDEPSWSPDGKRIAYQGFDDCVFGQRLDGSALRQLAACGFGSEGVIGGAAPDWQPLSPRG